MYFVMELWTTIGLAAALNKSSFVLSPFDVGFLAEFVLIFLVKAFVGNIANLVYFKETLIIRTHASNLCNNGFKVSITITL